MKRLKLLEFLQNAEYQSIKKIVIKAILALTFFNTVQ